jgi:hypothetical protein
MALLIVEAVTFAGPPHAAAGNRKPAFIIASITDANGAPVTGIPASGFKVHAPIVAAGGAEIVISTVFEPHGGTTLPGYYRVEVVPFGTFKWLKGTYIFALAVTKGSNKGQTIMTASIP